MIKMIFKNLLIYFTQILLLGSKIKFSSKIWSILWFLMAFLIL